MSRLIIETEHSAHVWDVDGKRVMRQPRADDASKLRLDGEWLNVIVATDPVIGERWLLIVQIREDGVQTARVTTPVVRMWEAEVVRG